MATGSSVVARHRLFSRENLIPFVVAIVSVAPYLPLILSGNDILYNYHFSDYYGYQLPVREFVGDELAQGRFPHWMPWVGCGIPMHATMHVGLCYPLLTPLQFVLDANMGMKVALVMHAAICYVGQYQLGRRLGQTLVAASLGGLVATWSGYLTSHLAAGHVLLVCAYALIPWLLLSTVEVCRRPGITPSCGFAAAVALLLLSGHPQVPYYALLFAGIWALASLVSGEAAKHRRRVIVSFALGLLLGTKIAAVQLLPSIGLLRDQQVESERDTFEHATMYAMDGIDLCRLFVPSLRGNLLVDIPEAEGLDYYYEKSCYLGVLTWMLVGCALLAEHGRRWPWGVALLIVLGVLISLGSATPVFSWLWRVIPGMAWFRCPARCLAVVSILVALLAGRGFDVLTCPSQRLNRGYEASVLAAIAILGLGALFVVDRALVMNDLVKWSYLAREHYLAEFMASGIALIAAIAFLIVVPRLKVVVALAICVVVLAGDTGWFNLRCVRLQEDPREVFALPGSWNSSQDRLYDGRSTADAVTIRYTRLVPPAVRTPARMLGTNEGAVLPAACEEMFQQLEADAEALQFVTGCGHIANETLVRATESSVLPRIWFCPASLEPLLLNTPAELNAEDRMALLKASHATAIDIEVDEPQRLIAKLNAETEGTLVVADTFYAEWTAYVDRASAEIRSAFSSLRGVSVGPGPHAVEMRFVPTSFCMGLRLSGMGLLLILSIVTQDIWKRWRRGNSRAVA